MKLKDLLVEHETPKFKIVDGELPESFPVYLRSIGDIKSACNNFFKSEITVYNIIKLFSQHNNIVVDSIQLMVPPESLIPYREYTRDVVDGYTGKHTEAEFNDLKSRIAKNGITEPLMLCLARLKSGDVKVYLGEGNHRLKIATELDIKKVPLRFVYYKAPT